MTAKVGLTILDPEQLIHGPNHRRLIANAQLRMAHDSLNQDIANIAQQDTHMDELDMQRVFAALADVHHSDFVEILPVLHLGRV